MPGDVRMQGVIKACQAIDGGLTSLVQALVGRAYGLLVQAQTYSQVYLGCSSVGLSISGGYCWE